MTSRINAYNGPVRCCFVQPARTVPVACGESLIATLGLASRGLTRARAVSRRGGGNVPLKVQREVVEHQPDATAGL